MRDALLIVGGSILMSLGLQVGFLRTIAVIFGTYMLIKGVTND